MDIVIYFMLFVLAMAVITGIVIGAKAKKMKQENEDLWNLVHDLEERG